MKKIFTAISAIIVAAALVLFLTPMYRLADWYNIIPRRSYTAEYFDIETEYSTVDYNNNGTDDYTDILLGARQDAKNRPDYDPAYVEGGYPPEDKGVCTDVVWRAFRNAGYSLRDMVDRDIMLYPEDYPRVSKRDNNIDFRRVVNLRVFFDKYATEITTDTEDISHWQPGDIVIFKDNKHIGIVSDKRTKEGKCYIIHNGGQPVREENYLKRGEVLRHYRFDAALVDDSILIPWSES